MTVLVLFALAAYQSTTATAATRLLGRVGASLVELDRWLPGHQEDLRLLASDRPQSAVRLNDLPIDVSLPAALVIGADEEELRTRIVGAMGVTLYREGNGAFRDENGRPRPLSIAEPVRWTVTLLDRHMHGFWKAALPLTLLLLIAVAAAVLMGGASPAVPMLVGAGFAAAGSLAAWLLLRGAESMLTSAVDKEIALVFGDCAWIGLRDSAAILVIGVTLVFLSGMIGRQHEELLPPSSPSPDSPFS